MKQRSTEEIARILCDGDALDRAFVASYRRQHLRAPLVVWKDGRVVEVSADDVELPEVDDPEPVPNRGT